MSKIFVPFEQVKKFVNSDLNDAARDQDLKQHFIAATKWAETYTRRKFDGELLRTEYRSSNSQRRLTLSHYPLLSIDELNIDSSQAWASTTIVDAANYWTNDEVGELSLISSASFLPGFLGQGDEDIRIKYYGGFIAEKTVVSPASKNPIHTIADNLLSYESSFDVFVKTSGHFTSAGTGIVVTGLDENGDAISETIIPYSNDTTLSKITFNFLSTRFTKITAVDSSELAGTGLVSVTGCSMPSDLRSAICILTAFLYKLDQQARIGVRSRSTQGQSETIAEDKMPPSAKILLDLYKNWNA